MSGFDEQRSVSLVNRMMKLLWLSWLGKSALGCRVPTPTGAAHMLVAARPTELAVTLIFVVLDSRLRLHVWLILSALAAGGYGSNC